MTANKSRVLVGISIVLLGFALLFLAGVVERWVAALWMVVKFYGKSPHGFISLSAGTAWIYGSMALMLMVFSYTNGLLAGKCDATPARSISKFAFYTYFVAIALCLVLGFGPFNQWRP